MSATGALPRLSVEPTRPSVGPTSVVRAPGKAMIFGEYAVLGGSPALVAAVDRYVSATRVSPSEGVPDTPFVREARAAAMALLAARGIHARLAGLVVDSSALYVTEPVAAAPSSSSSPALLGPPAGSRARKLGLGSSAAVTVAVFGPHPNLLPQEIWSACQEAHTRAQGSRGSGADLAAAIWGGVLRFRPNDGAPDVAPIALSSSLELTLVDTGAPASTGDRLARLSALQAGDPARHRSVMGPLEDLAASVCDEAERHGEIPLAAVARWNLALDALADAIGLEIRTTRHRDVDEAAREAGGAAKPSGAGGGDLAVCFTPREASARLAAALGRRGLAPLQIRIGAPGLHVVDEHGAPLDIPAFLRPPEVTR